MLSYVNSNCRNLYMHHMILRLGVFPHVKEITYLSFCLRNLPGTNGYSVGVMNIGALSPVLFSAAAKAIEKDTVFISFLIQIFPFLLHEGHHAALAGRAVRREHGHYILGYGVEA